MLRAHRPLLFAFCLSLLAHALPWVSRWAMPTSTAPAPAPSPALQATLSPPPLPTPPTPPPLEIPQPAGPAKKAPLPAVDRKIPAKTWNQAIREQFVRQHEQGLFYPEEAVQRGLQGEALVLLIIDTEGQVVAARIEESSGHALLDAAAVAAVRRLRSLPADAPREALLPVRFRLR